MQASVSGLQVHIAHSYQASVAASHHGHPDIIYKVHTGRPGRPQLVIDPDFLRQGCQYRGPTKLARFLKCGVMTVGNQLLEYGIDEPGADPFPATPPSPPPSPIPTHSPSHPLMPNLAEHSFPSLTVPENPLQNSARPASTWSNAELDEAVLRLRVLFPQAGGQMLEGIAGPSGV